MKDFCILTRSFVNPFSKKENSRNFVQAGTTATSHPTILNMNENAKSSRYYRDLTIDNINDWLDGFGDLPQELEKFALTCPHWQDGLEQPPEGFAKLRSCKEVLIRHRRGLRR
jgi:hypothetical protein